MIVRLTLRVVTSQASKYDVQCILSVNHTTLYTSIVVLAAMAMKSTCYAERKDERDRLC